MAKYIDAESIDKVLDDIMRDESQKDFVRRSSKGMIGILKMWPAADVAPVVHAHWIKEDVDENTYFCSACEALWMLPEGSPEDNGMHYCPNCGAEMGMGVQR